MFKDKKRFWVIFDTGTRREYYLDVHNLLSLPIAATLRYEYRADYLSPAAEVAAKDPESAPVTVLLLYAQWDKYVKGDKSKSSPPMSEMIWIPTRLAEMQLIPAPEGENFFFDFKVLGYPNLDSVALKKILDCLVTAGEVPFQKWVSVSSDLTNLAYLQRGNDSENWQAIVDQLGSPPVQFTGDSFFRIKGPYRGSAGRLVYPTYIEEKQTTEGEVEVRKVGAIYDVFENENLSLEVISASPPPSAAHNGVFIRKLELQEEKDGLIVIEGAKSLDLRQYTSGAVKFRIKRYDELDERLGMITFNAGNREDGWPLGANFVQNYRIRKRPAKVVAALLTGTLAVVLLMITMKLYDQDWVWAIVTGLIGTLLGVIAILLLTGKLGFKL